MTLKSSLRRFMTGWSKDFCEGGGYKVLLFFICCVFVSSLLSISFHKSNVQPESAKLNQQQITHNNAHLQPTSNNKDKHNPLQHLNLYQPQQHQPPKAMAWYTTDYCTICCRHIPVYSWYYHSYTCRRRTVTTTTGTSHGTRRSHSRHREREREYEYETTIRRTRSRSRHRSTSYYYYLPWRHHRPAPEPVRCPTPAPLPEPPCRRDSSDRDKGWRRRTVDIYIEH